MKNLRKQLIITMVMVIVALVFMIKGTSALSINPGTTNTANTTNTTTRNNTANNIIKTNNINTGNKDLPQTGENDIYIVTGIGILTIAIGGFAYIKSKRF